MSYTSNEKLGILADNAKELKKRSERATEARKIMLCELAEDICCEHQSTDTAYEKFCSLVNRASEAESVHVFLALTQKASLTRMLQSGSIPAGTHSKTAYVHNEYNQLAFDEFSEKISHPKSIIVPSFSAACQSVSDGECEFCILPIENSTDGRMLAFYSLIDRYELRICAITDIEDDTGRTVRYALLRKELWSFQERQRSTPVYLEFSLISANAAFTSSLLCAAEQARAVLESFDFLPLPYDTVQKKYFFRFRLTLECAVALSSCLSYQYPSYTLVGIYPDAN